MKMTLLSVKSTWLFVTGVTVISSYCVLANCQGKENGRRAAERISKSGTVAEYKPKNRHSSAVKKTTTATAIKEVKLPTYVPNPIYPSFTNSLEKLTKDVADFAKRGEVPVARGVSLVAENGRPVFRFAEDYTKVSIGGMAIGDELKGGRFSVSRKRIENSNKYMVGEVSFGRFRRLDEPEFYCTDVTYSANPATRQIDSIRMSGKLRIGNEKKAHRMVDEIKRWMRDDFGAVDRHADVPSGMIAFKKFRIGREMDAVVEVKWNTYQTAERGDSTINITFSIGELEEENKFERQELGEAADKARLSTLSRTGVDYFTVRPMVREDEVKRKTVY